MGAIGKVLYEIMGYNVTCIFWGARGGGLLCKTLVRIFEWFVFCDEEGMMIIVAGEYEAKEGEE